MKVMEFLCGFIVQCLMKDLLATNNYQNTNKLNKGIQCKLEGNQDNLCLSIEENDDTLDKNITEVK